MRNTTSRRAEGDDAVPARGHAARGLLSFGILVAVAIVSITGYEIRSQRQDAYDQARRELVGLNVALAEHTERVIATVDFVVSDVAAELAEPIASRKDAAGPDLHRLLRNHVSGLPTVASLVYADADGRILAHSADGAIAAGLSAADRPYFAVLRAKPDQGLLISEPFVDRFSPKPQIAISRAVVDSGGRFLGVVAAGLEIEYFVSFYRDVVNFEGGSAALFRNDGRLMVRYPEVANSLGRPYNQADFFSRHLAESRQGTYRTVGAVDQRQRLVSYRALDRYPLSMLVTLDEEVLIARWRTSAWRLGATALLGILVVWGLVALIRRRMRAEERQAERLAQSEEQFRVMVERASDALILHDMEGRIVMVNQLACQSLGYSCQELTGRHVGVFVPSIDFGPPQRLWQEVTVDHPVTVEAEHRRKDGTTFPVEVRLGAFEMNGRRLILALARDISERKAYQARLEQQASHDMLTGLPNRLLFLDRLQTALAAARRNTRRLALLFIDLNDFKQINDTRGHAAGDAVLVAAGRRIAGVLREVDTVARFGGDEFVVLLPEVEGYGDGEHVARKIRDAFAQQIVVGGHGLDVTLSLGIALFPDDGEDEDSLLHHADSAMYLAKEARRRRLTPA